MDSFYRFGRLLGILTVIVCQLSCTSLSGDKGSNDGEKYLLRMKSKTGRIELLNVRSVSAKKRIGEDQISRNEIESVDFSMRVETTGVNDDGEIEQLQKVIKKEGENVRLHDMGFPEMGEELSVRYSPVAQVLKAGRYPRQSVFYVSPVSLPKRAVGIGETWDLHTSWVNTQNGIEMKLHLVSILKRVIVCGSGKCADIEISGDVQIPALKNYAKTSIRISGRVLFSMTLGMVIWQEIRNHEELKFAQADMVVESCLKIIAAKPATKGLSALALGCAAPFEEQIQLPF